MQAAPDDLFKTLADPTRRAIFERLVRDGEQAVRALTDHAGLIVLHVLAALHHQFVRKAGLLRQNNSTETTTAPGESP